MRKLAQENADVVFIFLQYFVIGWEYLREWRPTQELLRICNSKSIEGVLVGCMSDMSGGGQVNYQHGTKWSPGTFSTDWHISF